MLQCKEAQYPFRFSVKMNAVTVSMYGAHKSSIPHNYLHVAAADPPENGCQVGYMITDPK